MDAALSARLRADAASIVSAAITAADPAAAVERAIPQIRASLQQCTHIIAIGKAAPAMTLAAMRNVQARSIEVVVPHAAEIAGLARDDVRIIHAAHPLPDHSSLAAGCAVDELISGIPDGDVVLFLVSGGASSLIVLPEPPITFAEYAQCTDLLMRSGADIRELNTVRHHIDTLKGGGIARRTTHTHVVALILSDVIGDPLDIIASGPLSQPRDTPADAVRVLRARGVWEQCAPSIRDALNEGARTITPVPTAHVQAHIVANNRTAVDGAAAAARRLGYDTRIIEQPLHGAAADAGAALARMASDAPPRSCIIAGGETTVTVRGNGSGGRSQELALAAALELDAASNVVIAAFGTDGIDGPTDAAGAIIDARTIARIGAGPARAALRDNDSHTALDAAHALIRTGPTGTNVADVAFILRP